MRLSIVLLTLVSVVACRTLNYYSASNGPSSYDLAHQTMTVIVHIQMVEAPTHTEPQLDIQTRMIELQRATVNQ
jgi:hypothetical protein